MDCAHSCRLHSLVTTIFHWDFAKEMNVHFFRKDLAIAGGLLLAAYSYSDR
jgi:hypothetical protein